MFLAVQAVRHEVVQQFIEAEAERKDDIVRNRAPAAPRLEPVQRAGDQTTSAAVNGVSS